MDDDSGDDGCSACSGWSWRNKLESDICRRKHTPSVTGDSTQAEKGNTGASDSGDSGASGSTETAGSNSNGSNSHPELSDVNDVVKSVRSELKMSGAVFANFFSTTQRPIFGRGDYDKHIRCISCELLQGFQTCWVK